MWKEKRIVTLMPNLLVCFPARSPGEELTLCTLCDVMLSFQYF